MLRLKQSLRPNLLYRAKFAFTLIELLVVIAIIAILAAILFPVFARARENARKTSCMSNMKQIGLGTMQYTQDYDEYLPSDSYGTGGPAAAKWMDVIYPYVKSEQLFTCPSDSRTNNLYNSNYAARTTNDFGSYAINNCYYAGNEPFPPRGSNISRIPQTAETIWLTDVSDQDPNNPTFFWQPNNTNPTIINTGGFRIMQNRNGGGTVNYGVMERHLETTPVLFCDGHVKALKVDALTQRGTQLTTNFPAGGAYRLFTIDED